jgi:hypothetical protein
VGEQRRWTTVGAARRFEDAAREAENQKKYRLAAALYRAALLVLKGEPADEERTLADAGCTASAYGERPHWGAATQKDAPAGSGWTRGKS